MFLKERGGLSSFVRTGTRQSVTGTARKFFKIEAIWCTMDGGVFCGRKRGWQGANGRWEGKLVMSKGMVGLSHSESRQDR